MRDSNPQIQSLRMGWGLTLAAASLWMAVSTLVLVSQADAAHEPSAYSESSRFKVDWANLDCAEISSALTRLHLEFARALHQVTSAVNPNVFNFDGALNALDTVGEIVEEMKRGYTEYEEAGCVGDKLDLLGFPGIMNQSQTISHEPCPERIPGQGRGKLAGGFCIYPKPEGGCSKLGDGCTNDNSELGANQCKCPKSGGINPGGVPDPGQILPR